MQQKKILKDTDDNALMVECMLQNLKTIYSNKSSEEYKSHGDITKVSVYSAMENSIANLSSLKKFPAQSVSDMKQLFNVLHRPVWKKMVTEFMHEPNDRNIIFTAVYTTGYRLLRNELGRIYASTEATPNGIVYKPDKVSQKKDMSKFIRSFNADLEDRLDRYIKSSAKNNDFVHQKAANIILATIDQVVGAATGIIVRTFDVIGSVFGMAKELNPLALMNALLTRHYDKKVEKFSQAEKMYKATKEAYEDYMKLPASKRKEKIEHRYIKNMEKYNIKMLDLKAEIDHYDKRAHEEAGDEVMTLKKRHQQKKEERERKRQQKKAEKEAEKKKPASASKEKNTSSSTSTNKKEPGDDKNEKPDDVLENKDVDKDNESQANPSGKKDNNDFDWDF